jgi:ketosteroid isomerase-like protein
MGTETNKMLVTDFFSRFTAGDIAGALDLMADDATWWIAGRREQQPAAGEHRKDQIARLFHNMAGQLKDGLTMTVKGAVAEADKVAVEAESYGELKNGRVYNQQYHLLMTIRDGRISVVREDLDTQHVFATWFEP